MAPTRSFTRFIRSAFSTTSLPGGRQDLHSGDEVKKKSREYEDAALSSSSTLSSPLQVPNVYVIPPEEEQSDTPPWCFFDAEDIQLDCPISRDGYLFDSVFDSTCDSDPVSKRAFKRSRPHEVDVMVVLPDKRPHGETVLTIGSLEEKASRLEDRLRGLEMPVRPPSDMKESRTLKKRALSIFKSVSPISSQKGDRVSNADLIRGGESIGGVEPTEELDLGLTDSSYPTRTVKRALSRKSPPLSQIFNFAGSNLSMIDLDVGHPPGDISCHPLERSTSNPSVRRKPIRRLSMIRLRRRFLPSVNSASPNCCPTPSITSASTLSETLSPISTHDISTDDASSSEASTPSLTDYGPMDNRQTVVAKESITPLRPVLPEVKFALDSLHFESLQFQSEDF